MTVLKNGITRDIHTTYLCPPRDLNPSPAQGRIQVDQIRENLVRGLRMMSWLLSELGVLEESSNMATQLSWIVLVRIRQISAISSLSFLLCTESCSFLLFLGNKLKYILRYKYYRTTKWESFASLLVACLEITSIDMCGFYRHCGSGW